jgi:glycosyltransferase involved in cell wall biosynthesis
MIYFDVTKSGSASHRSGLTRVSSRLLAALGPRAVPVVWDRGGLRAATTGKPVAPAPSGWFLTPELFSADERPGFAAWLDARPCRLAAIFHDAIPLKFPHIVWPHSVARHPAYLKSLARFDRLWAVSRASRDELLGYWHWLDLTAIPPVDVLALGADLTAGAAPAVAPVSRSSRPLLLCVGILEPRKNQAFLLDVCADLWRAGLDFELHLVGRVNPHFGRPVVDRIRALRRTAGDRLRHHAAADDATLRRFYTSARATAFPTLAEGCGLPLLESLAHGVPCVHSDLPVLRENADAGGTLAAPVGDTAAWTDALRRILTDDTLHARLAATARARPLPTWAGAADTLAAALA